MIAGTIAGEAKREDRVEPTAADDCAAEQPDATQLRAGVHLAAGAEVAPRPGARCG